MTKNILTIDVEDWFHILGTTRGAPKPEEWEGLPHRVVDNTRKLMDIFEEEGAGATFFTLGWVARQHPKLIREMGDRGFDVACHGNVHEMVHTQTSNQFRADLRKAKKSLEDAGGRAVTGYRAAGFSITRDTPWAFDVLHEEGFRYDASVFPGSHAHGGISVPFRKPFLIETATGDFLYEFPVAAAKFGSKMFPFGGGGYFRLIPEPVTAGLVRQMNKKEIPATLYLHPREIDPGQPRMRNLPLKRKLKYYINVDSTESKLRSIVRRFQFLSIPQYLSHSNNRVDAGSRVVSFQDSKESR